MIEILQTYGLWAVFILMMGLTVWTFANMRGRSGDGCCSEALKGATGTGPSTSHQASQRKDCCH